MDDLYDGGASVYNQAKDEYTKQLVIYLTPAIFTFFMKVFKQALEDSTISGRSPLVRFQEFIRAVPEWNIDKVVRETASVIADSKCDYLEELLSAVFIAHTKVLTAIRPNSGKNMKVQIVVPKLDHFVHRALSDASRILYKWTYLFQHDLTPIDKQKNYRAIEIQISEGILQAIRGLLPVKNILKDCLAKDAEEPEVDGDDSDSDDDDIVPAVKKADDKSGDDKAEQTPEPTPVAALTETKTVAAPPQDVAVEKLEEVAHVDTATGTVDVPTGSTADMSGNDKVFTGKESKEIAVEKVDSAAIIENIPIVPTIKVSKEEEEGEKKEEKADEGTPSVSFSDYDQVYTPFTSGGGKTSLTYAPKTEDDDFEVDIIGDATSELSDVEDLDFAPVAVGGLTEDDYEVM
jgi:hypothetical protein